MRPHLLQMEAFGPYAEPVSIPFDALSQEGLFLIHGSTGAGKTFLLDALCFALYGEVSGDRNLKGLRSDHAAPGAIPRVTLEFSAGGRRYGVERVAAHTAPKARGQGTTEKPPQAALFRLQGDHKHPLAARPTEVTREVEGLVGLNASQFRQVILLPQGKFAEVLRARAEERETLLKTLFDTMVFEQASQWLDENARAARSAQIDILRRQQVLRQQAAHEWAPYRGEGEGDTEPADQAGLETLLQRIQGVTAEAAAHLHSATNRLEAAQQLKQATDLLADRWRRRAAATLRLEELEGKAEVVEGFRKRWRTAERAEALRPSVEAEQAARQALLRLETRYQQALLAGLRAREGAAVLPPQVRLLDLQQAPSLEALQEASQALAARRAEVGGLVKLAKEAAEARAKALDGRHRLEAMAASLSPIQLAIERHMGERLAAMEACARARSARDQLEGLQRAAEEAQQLAQAVEAIAPAQQRQAAARNAQEQAEAGLQQARALVLELRQRQIDGMAAELARTLQAGRPCPVCGSTDHPAPQQGKGNPLAPGEIEAAEQEVNAATLAGQAKAAALAAASEVLRAVLAQAGEAADAPGLAQQAAQESHTALKIAQDQAQRVEEWQRAIATHERALQEAQEGLHAIRTQTAVLQSFSQAAQKKADTLQAELRQELGEGVDPQRVLQTFTPVEQALKELASCSEARGLAASRLEEASSRLARELASSGFPSSAAVEAALQDADTARRQQWAERIAAYDKEVVELKGALASPDLAALPNEEPDAALAEASVRQADQARLAALERLSEARGTDQDLRRLAADHRKGEEQGKRLGERAELVVAVAERCQGKAPPYISLQRWVLSAYLEDICRYANQRLELMTSSRYQLRLSDEGGRGGRQAGLGLRVLDAYTGEERDVNSLSGGETFQASLALALAVADTVEARAGGLHLETLFIDEGFGTLDPDNLQLAMDELDRLREGGRMIGIISHVGALKERIRAGIEVQAGDNGSTAKVVQTRQTMI
jgi:exonuclease SbcC